jgi:hypothetical protein
VDNCISDAGGRNCELQIISLFQWLVLKQLNAVQTNVTIELQRAGFVAKSDTKKKDRMKKYNKNEELGAG